VTYSYRASGKIATRLGQRIGAVTTTYGYDDFERLSSVDYSDNTPDVAFFYKNFGPSTLAKRIDAAGTTEYLYREARLWKANTLPSGAVGATPGIASGSSVTYEREDLPDHPYGEYAYGADVIGLSAQWASATATLQQSPTDMMASGG
jgi:hypothetical protein